MRCSGSRTDVSSAKRPGPDEHEVVARQLGRPPRGPWRTAHRCEYGFPSVIASPSVLEDGERFPTTFWLTCPFLDDIAARAESRGECAQWAAAAASDDDLAGRLREADREVRAMRAAESGGVDSCDSVGLAGQRDPLGVKCLHAHVAYALVGIGDPIGQAVLDECGSSCPDARCTRLQEEP